MKIGLFLFTTMDAVHVGTLARVAEEAGIESIWVPEHTHMPVDHSKVPVGGGDPPRSYSRLLDPLMALTAAASTTERVLLGTAVTLTAVHDPIILAKQIATVDHLSNGRLILGVGSGWNEPELANHGVDFDTRWGRAREHLEAMKVIWTSEEASFAGKWVNFERIWSWPKPAQKPHPKVLFGTIKPSPLVIKYADGWLPLAIAHPGKLREKLAQLRQMAEKAGRDPDTLDITVMYLEQVTAEMLAEFADAGATRVVVRPPVDDLERYTTFISRYATLLEPV
jgi:probable F420-dependent oxidoreductase